jgi:hypothetical protein
MRAIYISISIFLILIGFGCSTTVPTTKTSLEIQSIQSKEFETTKNIAFASVISVFQDLGYVVNSAEAGTGFITAKSPTSKGFVPFVGNVMRDTKATAFIEELKPGITRVRLNFVESKETSSGYGAKSLRDTPIENPKVYENAFQKIREGIFIRTATN